MFENTSCNAKNRFIATGKIEVPLYLTEILSEWTKAAIRTQPSDLLLWSQIYFSLKAIGKQPPVKQYLDPPDLKLGPGGLTPNTLKALAKTLSDEYETYDRIETMWNILSLKKKIFMEIIKIGNFKNNIKSNEFIGIAAAYLNNSLKGTMILLCDTLSTDDSSGILLEIFVEIYQYLARLNCVDIVLSSNENSVVELEIENYEENSVQDDSECFNSTSSQIYNLETEFSCHDEFEEPATNLLDIKSEEGIMIWKDVNMDHGPESLTDILRTPMINTPMVTTVCDDKHYELLIKKLKDNPYDQEILSQLSVESVICDDPQSEISFDSVSDTTHKSEHLSFGELSNEEIIDNPPSLVLTETNYEKNDFGIQTEDIYNDYTEINSEVLDEISMIKYEDNINEMDSEMNEETKYNIDSLTNIEVNKDFIVMMALVGDANEPLSNIEAADESLGDNESLKSEFSMLEKIDLNLNTADDDNNNIKVIKQIFDETTYMTNDKESSDSEVSSGSEGFHHSDIEQQSNRSVALEKSSIHSESNNSVIYSSKDDLVVSLTDNNKFDEDQLTLNELSESAQYEFIDMPEDEPFDQNKETVEECEAYSNKSEKSIEIPLVDKNVDSKINYPEKRIRVMLGIGPALSEKQIKYVIKWVTECASKQNNHVQAHNLIHFQCPPLDYESESSYKKSDQNACF